MSVIIVILIFLAVVMVIMAFAQPRSRQDAAARLKKLRSMETGQESSDSKDGLRKIALESREQLSPFAKTLLQILPNQMVEQLEIKLQKSGQYQASIEKLLTNQIMACLAFPSTFILLNILILNYQGITTVTLIVIVLAIIGFWYPVIRLNTQIEQRRRSIFRAFPNFLDLLNICLEAGMGLDAALNLVIKKAQPSPLRDELEKTLKEIKIGKPRGEALKDMGQRLDMKEVTSFVIAVTHAEQMGVSLSQTLTIQSEIARDARWQKAQELAQKAPVKLLFPMLLLIFPNIFLIIFGPLLLGFILGRT